MALGSFRLADHPRTWLGIIVKAAFVSANYDNHVIHEGCALNTDWV
jgi:hypothetical protein